MRLSKWITKKDVNVVSLGIKMSVVYKYKIVTHVQCTGIIAKLTDMKHKIQSCIFSM